VKRPGVLVLTGPTASGKTELSIALAREFDAEIVSADSRQIYAGMPVGTAAPDAAQRAAVPHHLIGFLDPHERYSAARFSVDATRVIEDILARGKRAIVAGGTGFYVRALTGGVSLAPEYDAALRERLAAEARVHDPEFLHEWLRVRDPARAAAVHPGDTYRVLRALEVALADSSRSPRTGALDSLAARGIAFAKVFLDIDQAQLDERIERRTRAMLEAGLLDEAQRIGNDAVASSAVGYQQANAYLRGWLTYAELRALLIRSTRRYAKRQFTWFRSEPGTIRVDAENARERLSALAREKLGWP